MLEMPLNFRSSLALVFLDSQNRWFDQGALGNTVDTADQDYSLMAVGGQLFGANSFLLDGSWNGMMAYNGVMYVPSIDTVQEFKMSTNTFSAQYAMSEGNVISVVTKGGTDRFHGDMYEFLRNYALDANLIFNKIANQPRTATRMNQFGATEGGPLYIPGLMQRSHKTFFFGGYEGAAPGPLFPQLSSTVPDSSMVSWKSIRASGRAATWRERDGCTLPPRFCGTNLQSVQHAGCYCHVRHREQYSGPDRPNSRSGSRQQHCRCGRPGGRGCQENRDLFPRPDEFQYGCGGK